MANNAPNPQLQAGWTQQKNGNESLVGNSSATSTSSSLARSGLLAWSDEAASAVGTFLLAAAGSVYGTLITLPQESNVSGLWYDVTTAGATLTSGDCWALFFNAAGTLLGQSADQHTTWATAGLGGSAGAATSLTASSSGALSSLPPGDYFGAVVATGTTLPTFATKGCPQALYNLGLAVAKSKCAILATGVTTTPANVTPSGFAQTGSSPIWMGVAGSAV